MLVIRPKCQKRGGGLFDVLVNVGKKLASKENLHTIVNVGKKIASKENLNTIINSKLSQKLSEAAVKGLASGTEELIKDSMKRKASSPVSKPKKIKLDINHIVDGGGIVFD